MKHAFRWLAKFKALRGTALDPFGYTTERRMERGLIRDCESLIVELLANLAPKNHRTAVELACLPERIRGFAHIKDSNVAAVSAERGRFLQ